MKTLALVLTLILSVPAFAAWNEVECEGRINGAVVRLEVEQPFPNGSYWKRATLSVDKEGRLEVRDFNVVTRFIPGFNRIEYSAPDLRLEVDFWPDQRPRWGMTYRGSVLSSLMSSRYERLNCRFPNIW